MAENCLPIVLIIVNWNSGTWLKKCLQGVAAQTVQPQRVLLIDNGSTDCSLTDVEEILPEVEVLCQNKNLGFARANNVALQYIDGSQWTVLLNPDAIPESDWLKSLLSIAEQHTEYDFFACKMVDANNQDILDGAGDVYHTSGHAWRAGFGQKADTVADSVTECFSPCAAAAMYRTDILKQAGGFDERFFCYFEDVDLSFRLHLLGYRCLFVPAAVVAHAGSATTAKRSDFSVYYGHRNMIWTYVKNMPWPLFWLYLPQHILMNLVSVFVLARRGQGRVALKAKWDAIKELPAVWRDRREIQQHRKVKAVDIWRQMEKGMSSLLRRD